MTLNRLDEAETEFSTLLKISNDNKAKLGLATVFFKKGSYSACNVILEEVIEKGINDINIYTLYAKGLLKENSIAKAIEAYKKALEINPKYFDEALDSKLRNKGCDEALEVDEKIDSRFLLKPNINFSNVGGMIRNLTSFTEMIAEKKSISLARKLVLQKKPNLIVWLSNIYFYQFNYSEDLTSKVPMCSKFKRLPFLLN